MAEASVDHREVGWPVYLVAPEALIGAQVVLEGDEGRHAVSVRRHRVGEVIVLTDGRGAWAAGPVGHVHGRDRLVVEVVGRGFEPAPSPTLTVVQAVPKSDRAEDAVELLTAVGVDRLVPWQASRCVTKWAGDRAERGLRRWRRTAAEAAKQSRRVWLPDVAEPCALADVVAHEVAGAAAVFVCHEQGTAALAAASVPTSGRIVVVIGPEGGLAAAEVDALRAAGGQVVSLGPTVLRAASAGAVAATLVLGAAGRLG